MKKTTKISILASLLIFAFTTQIVTAQFGYESREDDYIKGPVYLYKKTVMKDYTEKFGEYEPSYKGIEKWFMYDKEGRKTFEQKDRTREGQTTAYERTVYYFSKDKLILSAYTFTIGNEEDNYRFTYYKYPQSKIMEENVTSFSGNELIKGFTKKYNSKNLLIEESKNLGKEFGYKKVYKYDENGKTISYMKYNGIGALQEKTVSKRDNKGNLLEKIRYNAEGQITRKEIYEYNNAGKEIKFIEYNSEGKVSISRINEYINDSLVTKITSIVFGKKYLIKREYDKNNKLIKQRRIIWEGEEVNKYSLNTYYDTGELKEIQYYSDDKLYIKETYSDYYGEQYLSIIVEYYDDNGNVKEHYEEKYDKYGNTIAYEKYKYETKFGEKQKIPIEKHEIDISYYDGTPNLDVQMKIVKEKFTKKGKKENVLKISIKNSKVKPKMHFYDKPGITIYGGDDKKHKHVESYSFNTQYNYFKQFYRPYFIVEAGNEVLLLKIPTN